MYINTFTVEIDLHVIEQAQTDADIQQYPYFSTYN